MPKKFYLINFFLILIVVFLAVENYEEWTSPAPVWKETSPAKSKAAGSPLMASVGEKKEPAAPAQFKTISDKNIFSPDRKEFPIPTITEVKKPSARPNITLFGIAVGEAIHSALVTNPTRRADRGERETMTVKEGDRVGEYTVAKILADRITLESSGDSFDVLLYDPTKQKKRPVVSPVPSPSPVLPPSPIPPRPYTPPGGTPPVPLPRPGGVITPPSQPGRLTGRDMIRGRIDPRRAPVPAPRTPSTPAPDDDDDEDDE